MSVRKMQIDAWRELLGTRFKNSYEGKTTVCGMEKQSHSSEFSLLQEDAVSLKKTKLNLTCELQKKLNSLWGDFQDP